MCNIVAKENQEKFLRCLEIQTKRAILLCWNVNTRKHRKTKKISEMKIGYLGDCRRRNIKKKTRRAGKFTHIECRQNWKLNPHTNTPLATRKNKHPHKHTSTQFHRGRERERVTPGRRPWRKSSPPFSAGRSSRGGTDTIESRQASRIRWPAGGFGKGWWVAPGTVAPRDSRSAEDES